MKRIAFLISLFFLGLPNVDATHLMGGEITVQDLGNGTHQITLIAYRDTVGIPMATTASFNFDGPNGMSFTSTTPYDSIISGNLLPMYPYGVEIYLFMDTVTFPAAGLWDITWTNCCRNGAIQNLSNPLSENMLLHTSIEIDPLGSNSSAFFLVPAAIFLPLNTQWQYNPLPFDPDGDSLHWSIDQPLDMLNQYCAGYTTPPSDPNNPFRIDPITGTISWTANTIGNFVASILVDQYRNGQWIGAIRRDMQFMVVNPSQGHPLWQGLSNLPVDSNNQYSFNLTAGQQFKLEMIAGHTDPNRQMYMGAYSSLLYGSAHNATFSPSAVAQSNEIKGTLTWQPKVTDIREEPYSVVFRASDGYFTDDKTVLLRVVTAVNIPEHGIRNSLSIYPNPADKQLYIDFNSKGLETLAVEVLTINGKRIILQENLDAINGKNLFMLSTANLKTGAYFINIRSSNGDFTTKKLMVR